MNLGEKFYPRSLVIRVVPKKVIERMQTIVFFRNNFFPVDGSDTISHVLQTFLIASNS